MSDEVKQIIKSVNDGDMVATRDAFNQAVAQKIYDNIESKKEEIAIFNAFFYSKISSNFLLSFWISNRYNTL